MPTRRQEVLSQAKKIDGWCTSREGWRLYQLAIQADRTGHIVELGSYLGRSTVWLAAAARDSGREKIYTVDSWRGRDAAFPFTDKTNTTYAATLDQFRSNMTRLGLIDKIHPIPGWHDEIGDTWSYGPVSLLFVDGDHTYEGTDRALRAWSPHLLPNALVAFHDYSKHRYPTVMQYVNDLRSQGQFGMQGRTDRLAWGHWQGGR